MSFAKPGCCRPVEALWAASATALSSVLHPPIRASLAALGCTWHVQGPRHYHVDDGVGCCLRLSGRVLCLLEFLFLGTQQIPSSARDSGPQLHQDSTRAKARSRGTPVQEKGRVLACCVVQAEEGWRNQSRLQGQEWKGFGGEGEGRGARRGDFLLWQSQVRPSASVDPDLSPPTAVRRRAISWVIGWRGRTW